MIGLDRDISDKSREQAVTEFTLAVVHDCLADHLYRISIFESPNCPLCKNDKVMNTNHVLGCSALHGDSLVERYWSIHLLVGH
ncbi:hypothetical protein TNIN_256641 [Trichonephila inaurata madagascariensis]|uniref:Uncharacterized protein n=1 Tax=Trichonephila inaurata madagascariensis TaxID=2747483 RepID=A0A8X7CL79_9ARAC|nr:hypothetical protein TNIN_256641 [Trichonephila inaurata madagascariensis]